MSVHNNTAGFLRNPSAFPFTQPPAYDASSIRSGSLPPYSRHDHNPMPPYIGHDPFQSNIPVSHSQFQPQLQFQYQNSIQPQPQLQQQLMPQLHPTSFPVPGFQPLLVPPGNMMPQSLMSVSFQPQPELTFQTFFSVSQQPQAPPGTPPGSSWLLPDSHMTRSMGLQLGWGMVFNPQCAIGQLRLGSLETEKVREFDGNSSEAWCL